LRLRISLHQLAQLYDWEQNEFKLEYNNQDWTPLDCERREERNKMKNDGFSMFGKVPRVGVQYLKIIQSGEIVKWKSFSDITQLYEVESSDGKISIIQSNKISKQVAPDEEAEFMRLQIESSN
jgi:hypothetical protein